MVSFIIRRFWGKLLGIFLGVVIFFSNFSFRLVRFLVVSRKM